MPAKLLRGDSVSSKGGLTHGWSCAPMVAWPWAATARRASIAAGSVATG
ncbi:hypothetical protein [Sphingomonas hankookensis]